MPKHAGLRFSKPVDAGAAPAPKARVKAIEKPDKALVAAAMEAALTPAMRSDLKSKKVFAAVIKVPSPVWVKPVEKYLSEIGPSDQRFCARDGSNRIRDKASVGNDEVADWLSRGLRVIGIAANPAAVLPSTLVTAADVTITIKNPGGKVIANTMGRCLRGRAPTDIDDGLVAGLDFHDIVAALRAGSKPITAIRRLKRAAAKRRGPVAGDGIPNLATAVEYGAAREWGLSLARDIADYRAGKISWTSVDRGVVFHSAPGLGKTLLAQSISIACNVPLVLGSVSQYFASGDGHLEAVIKAQRATFNEAAALAPCILFLDEIDAMPNRDDLDSKNRDWWMPVVNDFLMLLDSAISVEREGVIVIGATNRIHGIDPAIMRPGRLERAIEILRPNLEGTKNILRHHLAADLVATDITDIAAMVEGSTGAEIMQFVRAARRRARQQNRALAIGDLVAVLLPAQQTPPAMRRRLAIHEAAHAVAIVILEIGRIRFVRLQVRGGSGGQTSVEYSKSDLITRKTTEDRIVGLLAARSSEAQLLGEASMGCGGSEESDLALATSMSAVVHASTALGADIAYRCSADDALKAVKKDPALRSAVEGHLRELQKRADDFVTRHRAAIVAVADALDRKSHLTGDEVAEIIGRIGSLVAGIDHTGGRLAKTVASGSIVPDGGKPEGSIET